MKEPSAARMKAWRDSLLPHIGYYCEGRDRWLTLPARWLWIALGWFA